MTMTGWGIATGMPHTRRATGWRRGNVAVLLATVDIGRGERGPMFPAGGENDWTLTVGALDDMVAGRRPRYPAMLWRPAKQ